MPRLENKPYMVIGTLSENNNYYEKETLKDSLDTLTGLLSKEALTNYATELINKKPDFNINMVIVDIDNFKLINNNFGHHFGDEIIKAIADTLDEIVRDRGVIGRFEGDEFIIIFSGFNDNMELRSYLRTMRMTVEEKFKNIKNTVDLSISIGTARYPTDGISFDELFEKSDSCLYIAKQKGKNRYIIYDEVIDIKNIEKKNKKNILTIESREKNAQLACRVIDILMKNNRNNIEDTIKILGEELKLSRIAIFFGKELKRIALWGDKTKVYDNARYIYKGSYLTNFNINGVCVVHSSTSIEGKNPEVHSDYTEQNIYSAIQCLIYGDTGDIAGIISFERSFQRKSWTENEIYNFTLISHLIGELLKKEA